MENVTGLPLLVSGVCALLLVGLIAGLIVSEKFRNDVLGGEGEASVLGVISVKGVAIVLLCGIFVGGMIYPMSATPSTHLDANAELANERNQLKSELDARNSAYEDLSNKYHNLQVNNQKTQDRNDEMGKSLEELKSEISALKVTIANKDEGIARLKEDGVNSDKFLRDVQLLEEQRDRFQGSIDTSAFDLDKKVQAFTITQRLLKRIGFYDGKIDGDADKTREALINYKKRTFKDERYWDVITRATIIRMIGDYSEKLLEELDG